MNDKGKAIHAWWRSELDRDTAQGRRLAAELRRAGPVEAVSEPSVHELARALGTHDAHRLARLVTLLAEVRAHVPQTLARRLGGAEPALSQMRFQRLMRAEGEELILGLRRALRIAEHRCNVPALGTDLLFWSEKTRITWCFHYFGAEAPDETHTAHSEETA